MPQTAAVGSRKLFLFVVPVFQAVYPQPFGNFLALMLNVASKEGDRYAFAPHVPARTLLHSAMNRACELVIENDMAGLIMADDDCFPPFDAISQLLRHYEHGLHCVSGIGYMRGFPHTTTVGRYFPEGIGINRDAVSGAIQLTGFTWLDDVAAEPDDLIPCDFSGFPISIVSVDALRRIEPPWFGTSIDGGAVTHDVFFGDKLRKAGIKQYVDRRIDCGHLLDATILTSGNRAVARGLAKQWESANTTARAIETAPALPPDRIDYVRPSAFRFR